MPPPAKRASSTNADGGKAKVKSNELPRSKKVKLEFDGLRACDLCKIASKETSGLQVAILPRHTPQPIEHHSVLVP